MECSNKVPIKVYFIGLFSLIIVNLNIYSQVDSSALINDVYAKAEILMDAYLDKDYDQFLNLTHPKIIDNLGGRDNMRFILDQSLENDLKILSNKLFKPQEILITDSIIQCSLKQRQDISIKGDEYYTFGYLIGISYNHGINWYFISVSTSSFIELNRLFPELNPKLDIHPQTKPIRRISN